MLAVEGIGFLSSVLSGDIKAIYHSLVLPPFSPPDYLFGIVWPVLYLLIAISGYLLFINVSPGTLQKANLIKFLMQLLLNFAWSIVFFQFELFWAGLIIILVMDIIVAMSIKPFYVTNKFSGYSFSIYLLWLLFATYLTVGVAILN
ncbi:TspO/MBR family protein [Secundilactobacillus oryzae]|uniref:TspO/MBR family protein n=1 Tax=Secundilactobacillus oryzae TaxID=1202668 RepID=UPI0006D079DF|nr:TspO/MBR family protein [Secundilactobacillus oryzae]